MPCALNIKELNDKYSRRLRFVPAAYPRRETTTRRLDDELKIALYDYHVQEAQPGSITLVFTHGTSFSKDLWHILVDNLLRNANLASQIKRVIALDAVNHGDSATINREKLRLEAYWPDNAYDILAVIDYLALSQPIIGIGHSFGGGILAHAATISPSSFVATIFVDPILFVMPEQDAMAAKIALGRRADWPALIDVQTAFEKSKGLSDWHPKQRAIYAENGTIEEQVAAGRIKRVLKTPKEQEAATYIAAPHPDLPGMIKKSKARHYFILGGRSRVISPDQRSVIQTLVRDPRVVQVISDAGHLIPMTHPVELTDLLIERIMHITSQNSATTKDTAKI